jgi:hypothetical protein
MGKNAKSFSFVVFALQFVHKIFCLAESLSIRIAASLIALLIWWLPIFFLDTW